MKPAKVIELNKVHLWILSPLLLLMLWELSGRAGFVSENFFPAPSTVLNRLKELLFLNGEFFSHILASLERLLIGGLMAVPLAILLAIVVEFNKYAAIVFKPLIALLYPLPKLAIFPLLIIILGTGVAAQIGIIFIGVFFLQFIETNQGVRSLLQRGYMDVAYVYKLGFWDRFYNIVFRGSLKETLTGLKLGMGYGLVMVVAGEFAFSRQGLGFFMWNAWDQFRVVDLYCGLFVFAFLGLLLFFSIDKLKGRLLST